MEHYIYIYDIYILYIYIYIYIHIFKKKLRNRKIDYNSLIHEKYNWMAYKY